MAEVTITFHIEGDDPDDPSGLSEDAHSALMDQIMQMGGYDIEVNGE